jgi:hypothetical protein
MVYFIIPSRFYVQIVVLHCAVVTSLLNATIQSRRRIMSGEFSEGPVEEW